MSKRNQQGTGTRVKVLAAVVGVCGVLAMGGLTFVLGGSQAQAAAPVVTDKPSQTGAGQTMTMDQVAPKTPDVQNAAPAPQATAWPGEAWPGSNYNGVGGKGGNPS